MKFSLFIVLLVGLPLSGWTADKDGRYSGLSYTCGEYLQARSDEKVARGKVKNPQPSSYYNINAARYGFYIAGLIDGFNRNTIGVFSSIPNTSPTRDLLVEAKCNANPAENLIEAVMEVIMENKPNWKLTAADGL